MVEAQGTCDSRFDGVRSNFEENLNSGADVGASVAVYLHGEPVVDLWGGLADEATGTPWTESTLANVFSSTKTMSSLCALVLADRGQLDFDSPVARYWPEFAQAGKEDVRVRHVMAHAAGLSGWDVPLATEQLADWELCTSALAAQEPWWEPGTAFGYHGVTQGYLVGEIVRRITGETLGTWFAREIAGALQADFFIGLPESEDARVSDVIAPPPVPDSGTQPTELARRSFRNPPLPVQAALTEWWRRAEIPSVNGHGNARSIAAIQAVVAGKGAAGGVRLLSPAGLDPIFEVQISGQDLVLDRPTTFGMGYGLRHTNLPGRERACYWGGYGGSLVIVDQDAELSMSYVMNKMAPGVMGDPRGLGLLDRALAALG